MGSDVMQGSGRPAGSVQSGCCGIVFTAAVVRQHAHVVKCAELRTRRRLTGRCRALAADPQVEWARVPNLPRAAVAALDASFVRSTSTVLHTQHSRNGETSKMLLRLQDGLTVEAVIMHYDTSGVPPPPPHRLRMSRPAACRALPTLQSSAAYHQAQPLCEA